MLVAVNEDFISFLQLRKITKNFSLYVVMTAHHNVAALPQTG